LLAVEGGNRGGVLFYEQSAKGDFALSDEMETLYPADELEEAAGIGSPAFVSHDGVLRLFYTAHNEDGVTRIRESRWNDSGWEGYGTVLEPGKDCLDQDGLGIDCWDKSGVLDSDVRLAHTEAGDELLRLFYAGHSGKKMSLGFAASYGEGLFSRASINPVLGGSKDFRHPSSVFFKGRYLLFYEERVTGGREGVGLAESSGGSPSEFF